MNEAAGRDKVSTLKSLRICRSISVVENCEETSVEPSEVALVINAREIRYAMMS